MIQIALVNRCVGVCKFPYRSVAAGRYELYNSLTYHWSVDVNRVGQALPCRAQFIIFVGNLCTYVLLLLVGAIINVRTTLIDLIINPKISE